MTTAITKTKPGPLDAFRSALAGQQSAFAAALPATVRKYLTAERITKITLAAVSRSPGLLKCTPTSILRCVMDAATLGLEPGGPLGHAYMVPFKNHGVDEAQLIIGYRGFIALARRSGEIESVVANAVYSRDSLKVSLSEGRIEHSPFMPPIPPDEVFHAMSPADVDAMLDRGRLIAVYCVAKFIGGGQHVDFMTAGDVEKVRLRSRARDSGPWVTDYTEMARKTVVKRAAKYWPLSTELADALDAENKAEAGELRAAQVTPEIQVFEGDAAEPPTATEKVRAKLKAKAPAEETDDATGEVLSPLVQAAMAGALDDSADDRAPSDGKTRDQREAEFRARTKREPED